MRKRTLGVVLLAGLAMSGAGAFTAANDLPTTTTAGYGAAAVTGATVTDIAYNVGADPSKLTNVVFTSTTDVTGKTATMTLRNAGVQVGSSYSCTLGLWTPDNILVPLGPGSMAITCASTEDIADFDQVGLTVVDA
ncbi:MAG: hypothetical protein EPN99_14290 [Frankiales bacterium]|nr:MAG: hypothetical protein EPN99_14290 [Frankiales bacterium]